MKILLALILALVVVTDDPVVAVADPACLTVELGADLRGTLSAGGCYSLTTGEYFISEPIPVQGTLEVVGNGSTIIATEEISTIFTMQMAESATITDLTMDANHLAVYGILGRDFTLDGVTIKNGTCSAIGIANTGVVVRNSLFIHNGWKCAGVTGLRYGGAVYAEFQPSHPNNCYAPLIENSVITDSWGPALDINRVSCGILRGNTIYDNHGPAAVGLYESGGWLIENNTIYHPLEPDIYDTQFHPACSGGPQGPWSASVKICRDSAAFTAANNIVRNNSMASFYGVLIIGDDASNYVPRLNTVRGNDLYGSTVSCADDVTRPIRVRPRSGVNKWYGCSPIYF